QSASQNRGSAGCWLTGVHSCLQCGCRLRAAGGTMGTVPIPSSGGRPMPKKTGAKKMQTAAKPKRRLANAVRLDLSDKDYERLERVAEERGLNKSSYARMAVVAQIRRDEEELGK